jgi:ribose transport system substrate-binding protein
MAYKRLFSLAAVMLLAAACGSTAPTQTVAPTEAGQSAAPAPTVRPYISIVSKGFQHQFWQAVKKGSEQEAVKEGALVNFMGPEGENQSDKQIDMLRAELAKKPAALCIAAIDSQAVVPVLQDYQRANIPVIGFDSGVDSDIPLTTAATDNLKAAALAADKLAEAIGGSGKVGLVVHDETSITGQQRRDGFMNEIKAKYPNITIIGPQYGGGDQAKSADIAKAMLTANPDLKGFFGSNEGSAIGVVKGVQEAGKSGKVVIVGYDSGQAQIDAIKNKTEIGAITQNPVGIGEQCVVAAMKAIRGESLPKTIDTGSTGTTARTSTTRRSRRSCTSSWFTTVDIQLH